jgi:hypothetical protein
VSASGSVLRHGAAKYPSGAQPGNSPLAPGGRPSRRAAAPTRGLPAPETRLRPSLGRGHTLLKLLRYLASWATAKVAPGVDIEKPKNPSDINLLWRSQMQTVTTVGTRYLL